MPKQKEVGWEFKKVWTWDKFCKKCGVKLFWSPDNKCYPYTCQCGVWYFKSGTLDLVLRERKTIFNKG